MEAGLKSVILIVDDKEANILAMEGLLHSRDRQFLTATNGNDALKIALNKNIDLVILDVMMPGLDGFEVAQVLKSNKRTKDIPILFASAEKKNHQFQMKGYEEGAVDFLFKPLDPEITKAKVANLLKIQLQKKELIEKISSLEKSRLLINNSADIIWIIDASTLRIEEINRSFSDLMGYSEDEAKKTSILFFLDPNDRTLLQGFSDHPEEQFSFEIKMYTKSRSIRWLNWKVISRFGKWFVNARDITEIREVSRVRDYLATVVKQSNDAIYIQDEHGNIISWNEGAEKIYGYTEEEAIGMKIWNITPEYLVAETLERLKTIIDGGKAISIATKRITKYGKIIDVVYSASVLSDPDSQMKSVAITERDITQQKKADEQIHKLNADLQKSVEQLQSSNRDLESFSYSVSHDLRAPLRVINGYAHLLKEDHSDKLDLDGNRLLDIIQSNALNMGHLIDDLLSLSRLGRKDPEMQMVDMNGLVKSVLEEIAASVNHRATLHIAKLPSAFADPALLKQVWINLVSNAVKYSSKKKKPEIFIDSTTTSKEITYHIRDNGAGFDNKFTDKLFGVFHRLHSLEQFEGTGIGLAIVHRIIMKHRGRVWAEGAVDQGATFYFTLPVPGPENVV
ncbi:MAG TPA: PAS domain S-box protein [Cyclobacteriaceae bacterium]|nr:PAS domain S-box protein [Cyclobacteriaceae bacterium]